MYTDSDIFSRSCGVTPSFLGASTRVTEILSKADFSRAIGVTRGAVGAMVKRGQISGPALIERGGRILVDADIARQQLRERLDIRQRAANGRARLDGDREAPAADPDPVMNKLKNARLRQAELAIEKVEAEASERSGKYVLASSARQDMGAMAARMVAAFEGCLPPFADAIAASTTMPQRDALHMLRHVWRDARARLAGIEDEGATSEPELIEVAP